MFTNNLLTTLRWKIFQLFIIVNFTILLHTRNEFIIGGLERILNQKHNDQSLFLNNHKRYSFVTQYYYAVTSAFYPLDYQNAQRSRSR